MTTTEQVKEMHKQWLKRCGAPPGMIEASDQIIDDWLNAIRAQAYDRGVHEREEIPYWEDGPVNPYLEQAPRAVTAQGKLNPCIHAPDLLR